MWFDLRVGEFQANNECLFSALLQNVYFRTVHQPRDSIKPTFTLHGGQAQNQLLRHTRAQASIKTNSKIQCLSIFSFAEISYDIITESH